FTNHGGALRIGLGGFRARVTVAVDDISDPFVGPSTGIIDQTRRIERFQPGNQPLSIILSPAFIKEDPDDDGGMAPAVFHDSLQFSFKLNSAFRSRIISAGHVLPNQKAQLITPIVPSIRFYLHMFASQVKPS